jgi:hypothetical protein
MRTTILRSALLLLLVAACGDKKSSDPKPGSATPTVTEIGGEAPPAGSSAADEPTPAASGNLAPSGKAGPAYLAVDGTGLVKLDGGKVTKVLEHEYPIRDMTMDAKGNLYAVAIGGAWKITGDKATRIDDDSAMMSFDRIAVGPDGVVWTIDYNGVHRYDGKAWALEPKATFTGVDLFYDVAVDAAGRVWVVTPDTLWRKDGDKWAPLDPKDVGGKQPYLKRVVAIASGEVFVAGSRGVFAFKDNAWRDLDLEAGYGGPDELEVGADGRIAGSGGVGDIVIAAPGQPGRDFGVAKVAKAKSADVIAVDGSGRAWVTTDNGLVILDGDGKLVQHWEPGTVAGITGEVQSAVVIGGGPALPQLGTAARGTVVGKVIQKGKPVAGATIELCASPSTFIDKTPCSDAPVSRTTTTGADGTFSLADVPVGSYGFAVKPGKQWLVMIGSNCCTSLENGGSFDIGAINLE